MVKIAAHLNRFVFGEVSPFLRARTDLSKYPAGCRVMENFIPLLQGAVRRRGGSRFVARAGNGDRPVALLSFVFSETTAYILEFGDKYMRVFNRGAPVKNTNGTPYQIVTPWTQADLFYASGICTLKYVQSGDVMYIVCPGKPPQKLSRYAPTDWRIAALPGWGSRPNPSAVALWRERLCLAAGQTVYFSQAGAFENFELTSRSIPGATITRHVTWGTFGFNATDGTVSLYYDAEQNAAVGFQAGEVTFKQSGDVITVTPKDVKAGLSRIGFLTTGWVMGSANSLTGEVTARGTSQLALTLKVDPQKSSISVDPAVDSSSSSVKGYIVRPSEYAIAADDPMEINVYSEQMNKIEWLCPASDLLVGTTGGEFIIAEATSSEPIGPENIKISPETSFGSSSIQPLRVGGVVVFVQRAGRKVREFVYDYAGDNYQANDATVAAEHVTAGGVKALAWQSEPLETMWAVRADGQLLGLTYSIEQEMVAWHRHILGGGGAADQLAVIPAQHGGRDELWLSVKRTVNSQTIHTIEMMDHGHDPGEDPAEAFFVDSGLTFRGSALTEVTGLDHLEGLAVALLADGGVRPERAVLGGRVTVSPPADVVQVGLPYTSVLTTLNFEADLRDGTAQGRTKRIIKVILRLLESGGGAAGPSPDRLTELEYRRGSDFMDQAVPLFTGDRGIDWIGGYETDGVMTVVQKHPLPFCLLAIIADIDIGGKE